MQADTQDDLEKIPRRHEEWLRPGEAGERAVGERDVLRAGGAANALEAMRDQGLTRFIGMTVLGDAGSCRRVFAAGIIAAAPKRS